MHIMKFCEYMKKHGVYLVTSLLHVSIVRAACVLRMEISN